MAKKISFSEFRTALTTQRERVTRGALVDDSGLKLLGNYLEFDPDSPRLRIRFRQDALTDEAPVEYDVDQEIYYLVNELQEASAAGAPTGLRVLAEGDSWFMLPDVIFMHIPEAIGNWISKHGIYNFRNIAHWGDTLVQMLAKRQYLSTLSAQTNYFLLSAGGNDFVDRLAAGDALYRYDQTRPIDQYLTPGGHACLNEIYTNYTILLSEVRASFPNLKIICFGYDYPRPLVAHGKHIGKHLRALGIPDSLAESVIRRPVELLGEKIRQAATENGARYINCLNTTDGYTWWDDMHPDDDGFEALALLFEGAISGWP